MAIIYSCLQRRRGRREEPDTGLRSPPSLTSLTLLALSLGSLSGLPLVTVEEEFPDYPGSRLIYSAILSGAVQNSLSLAGLVIPEAADQKCSQQKPEDLRRRTLWPESSEREESCEHKAIA